MTTENKFSSQTIVKLVVLGVALDVDCFRRSDAGLTVFAPTDAAYAAADEDRYNKLRADEDSFKSECDGSPWIRARVAFLSLSTMWRHSHKEGASRDASTSGLKTRSGSSEERASP